MSKVVSCLSVLLVALAAVSAPQPAAARSMAARGGASAFFRDGGCWDPWGPQMTNKNCTTDKFWTVPLILDGSLTTSVTVTVWAPDVHHNVQCRAQSNDKNNWLVFDSGWIAASQFSVAYDIVLQAWAPAGGTVIIDCQVAPGATVVTVNW